MRLVIVNKNYFCKNVDHQDFFMLIHNVEGLVSTVRQIGRMGRN